MNLLSVDWDFFFPNPMENGDSDNWALYDWGHREAPFFLSGPIWDIRAAGFLGRDLPLPGTSGDEIGFWDRFNFHPKTELFVVESHSMAATDRIARGVTYVWNFDAHHDTGYTGKRDLPKKTDPFDCGNWIANVVAHNVALVGVIYPAWKTRALEREVLPGWAKGRIDDGKNIYPEFHRVVVARSGAWSPPWLDEQFIDFVNAGALRLGKPIYRVPGDFGDPLKVREMSQPDIDRMARENRERREEMLRAHEERIAEPIGGTT